MMTWLLLAALITIVIVALAYRYLGNKYIPVVAPSWHSWYDKDTRQNLIGHFDRQLFCKHPEKGTFIHTNGGLWMDDAFEGTYCKSCGKVFNMRQTY